MQGDARMPSLIRNEQEGHSGRPGLLPEHAERGNTALSWVEPNTSLKALFLY